VYQLQVENSAALGAALRALHGSLLAAGKAVTWDEVVRDFAEPVTDSALRPDPERHAVYRELMRVYEAFETEVTKGTEFTTKKRS
jgi:sugar (pentulose or hexulose) kinase